MRKELTESRQTRPLLLTANSKVVIYFPKEIPFCSIFQTGSVRWRTLFVAPSFLGHVLLLCLSPALACCGRNLEQLVFTAP